MIIYSYYLRAEMMRMKRRKKNTGVAKRDREHTSLAYSCDDTSDVSFSQYIAHVYIHIVNE